MLHAAACHFDKIFSNLEGDVGAEIVAVPLQKFFFRKRMGLGAVLFHRVDGGNRAHLPADQ